MPLLSRIPRKSLAKVTFQFILFKLFKKFPYLTFKTLKLKPYRDSHQLFFEYQTILSVFYKIYTGQTGSYSYAIILFCLVCQVSFFPYIGGLDDYLTQQEYGWMLFVYFMLFTLFTNNQLMFIVTGPTLFLGKISYALYLTHQYIFLNFIIPFLASRSHIDFWIIAFLIDLPIVIGIATLITYKIEVPIGKKLKAKLQAIRV